MKKCFIYMVIYIYSLSGFAQNVNLKKNEQSESSILNRTVIEKYYELWNNASTKELEKYISNQIKFEDLAYDIKINSISGLKKFMSEAFQASQNMRFKITHFIENNNNIAVEWRLSAIDTESKKSYSVPGVSIITMKEGKIVYNKDYYDEESINSQLTQ